MSDSGLLAPGWRPGRRQVNGLSLHVVEEGPETGPLLVLLHGFPEFWWAWRHQITPLAEAGFHVVAPDMRGYNLSDAPQDIGSYRLDRLVADVAALADSFGADRFDVIGHDWGGVIAWAAAARHPDRIGRLVVMDAPHPDLLGRALRHPTQALRSSYAALFQLPLLPETALGAFGFAGLRALMRGSGRRDTFGAGDLDRYAKAWGRPGALTAMLNYYRALRHRQRPREPARIRAPTLILWGEKDVALERHVARDAVGLCDAGRLVIVGGTTHWLHLEEPDRISAEMLRFFLKG